MLVIPAEIRDLAAVGGREELTPESGPLTTTWTVAYVPSN